MTILNDDICPNSCHLLTAGFCFRFLPITPGENESTTIDPGVIGGFERKLLLAYNSWRYRIFQVVDNMTDKVSARWVCK